MPRFKTIAVLLVLFCLSCSFAAFAQTENNTTNKINFAVIGMPGGAFKAMKESEEQLGVNMVRLNSDMFTQNRVPDLSKMDVIITSFAGKDLEKEYKKAIGTAKKQNPDLKIFCVGPPPICQMWASWVGEKNITFDKKMASYYGLSNKSMQDMVKYVLINYFNHSGKVAPPNSDNPVRIFHPGYDRIDSVSQFLKMAKKNNWDIEKTPKVVIGSWRHHVNFHQPKVIKALVEELEKRGMLTLVLVADDADFKKRLVEYKPNLVIMTSHTGESAEFWKKLNVPRIHSLWFMDDSIEKWRNNNKTGMKKSEMFHLIVSAEIKGSTETLTAGGTEFGGSTGDEIIPIPDRIRHIAERSKKWINLQRLKNEEKKIGIIIYDNEADKGGLMSGPAHNLNAPESLYKLLIEMNKQGYKVKDLPIDTNALIERVMKYGRQMGAWEPGNVDRLARSGKAVLISEDDYRNWFEQKIPEWRRKQVLEEWGGIPGKLMVWENRGKKYIVLPVIRLGNIVLATQPPKGESLTATTHVDNMKESLLPPTHNYLATYFWLQESFKADSLVHFGTHGTEWLFPGKMAALSNADWADILIGNLPNINPWLSSNIAEILPARRRANAVTVNFLPPPLMQAGLPDELLNLESTISKYNTLEEGALKIKFGQTISKQAIDNNLEHDLDIKLDPKQPPSLENLEKISLYLHDLGNEMVPAGMHVLGEVPPENEMFEWLVYCMGKKYLKTATALFGYSQLDAESEKTIRNKAKQILHLMIDSKTTLSEALKFVGISKPEDEIPEEISESFEMAIALYKGLLKTPDEIVNILAGLNGEYIMPGSSGNPERNPAVVPTGKNMYVLNPQELPTKASWELGTKLIREYLKNELATKNRYPKKVAFSLVPFTTYSDYGIVESQIMYLIGVRPVWDLKNRVKDIELIPAGELGRPRIDVFLSARNIYRDELPEMMKLLDKAIRLVASVKEKNNAVYHNSQRTMKSLLKKGFSKSKAETLSQARMYGAKPEEILDSHDWFFYLTERTGEWESREDLLDVYLENSKHVYTKGAWGEMASEAFDSTIQGTELILRSWYDNRDYVLGNKFAWWVDGTLSMAIKHMTGKEPEYMFVDVRDPEEANIVDAKQVVQFDFRSRLTNPKWISEMMKENYSGANIIAQNINNMMGWEITREKTIEDDNWNQITDVFLHDSRNLGIDTWFENTNPYAMQKINVTMLETIRKQYWNADEKTKIEIAKKYAESVVKHGPGGGMKEGGNTKLEKFVSNTLENSGIKEMSELATKYQSQIAKQKVVNNSDDPANEPVTGKKMDKVEKESEKSFFSKDMKMIAIISMLVLFIILIGFLRHKNNESKK